MKFDWTKLIGPVLGFIERLLEKKKLRKQRRRLEKQAEERAANEKEYVETGKTTLVESNEPVKPPITT